MWTNRPEQPGRPEVVDEPAQPYLALATRATLAEWGSVNALIGDLATRLGEAGQSPVGPPFYRYRVVGGAEGEWQVEVAFPVESRPAPEGVIAGELEAGRYARWLHRGHPDQLASVWETFRTWMDDQGHRPDRRPVDGVERWGALAELFLTDPAVEPDPNRWDTLIVCRLDGS